MKIKDAVLIVGGVTIIAEIFASIMDRKTEKMKKEIFLKEQSTQEAVLEKMMVWQEEEKIDFEQVFTENSTHLQKDIGEIGAELRALSKEISESKSIQEDLEKEEIDVQNILHDIENLSVQYDYAKKQLSEIQTENSMLTMKVEILKENIEKMKQEREDYYREELDSDYNEGESDDIMEQ